MDSTAFIACRFTAPPTCGDILECRLRMPVMDSVGEEVAVVNGMYCCECWNPIFNSQMINQVLYSVSIMSKSVIPKLPKINISNFGKASYLRLVWSYEAAMVNTLFRIQISASHYICKMEYCNFGKINQNSNCEFMKHDTASDLRCYVSLMWNWSTK